MTIESGPTRFSDKSSWVKNGWPPIFWTARLVVDPFRKYARVKPNYNNCNKRCTISHKFPANTLTSVFHHGDVWRCEVVFQLQWALVERQPNDPRLQFWAQTRVSSYDHCSGDSFRSNSIDSQCSASASAFWRPSPLRPGTQGPGIVSEKPSPGFANISKKYRDWTIQINIDCWYNTDSYND